jgi:PAS domain S-box-containing protein
MFKTKIFYKLMIILLIFAAMILVPYTYTIVVQVNKLIELEESFDQPQNQEVLEAHRLFVSNLFKRTTPYIIYTVILAFGLSIFFMRKLLLSLKQLQQGVGAIQDGTFETKLEVLTDDEIGDLTVAFNEMADTLKTKTLELEKKETYIREMVDPLWVVDEHDHITDINPAFTRLFGYEKDEVLGASIYDFIDEKNALMMYRQLNEKRVKGIASMYEIEVITKKGLLFPVLISGAPIYSGNKIVGKIGILKDFREQSELKNELKRSKEYVETIMDCIKDEMLVIDRDYRVTMANQVARSNLEDPVEGDFCYKIAHNLDRPCWIGGYDCPAQMVFKTGDAYTATHKHVTKTGLKYHEIVATPIKDAAGDVTNVIELYRDVTERIEHTKEMDRRNRELSMLNSIAHILSRSLKAEEIFSAVLNKVIDMLHMDGGGIYFIDDLERELRCAYHRSLSKEYLKKYGRMRLGEDLPGKAAVTGQVITINDLSKDRRVEDSLLRHSGIRGYCCIPIRGKEKIIGVFCLFSHHAYEFTVEEERILLAIGEMTGIAVDNVKLYEKMRDLYEVQQQRREEEHAQLLSLSEKFGSIVNLGDVMTQVLILIKRFTRADFCWVLLNDTNGNLVLRAVSEKTGDEDTIMYASDTRSFEQYALERKTPVLVHDILTQEKFYINPLLRDRSYTSALSLPMLIGNKPVGTCSLYFITKRLFREEELHFLQIVANSLTVAVQRSELYREVISKTGLSDTILNSVQDAMITVDHNGRTVSINKAFTDISNISMQSAIGLSLCDLLNFNDENDMMCVILDECLASAVQGKSVRRDGELKTTYGDKMSVRISSDPVLNADQAVTGAVFVLRDMSREKNIDRIKTEIIRSVSHQFRTPLSAIVGMSEMILEDGMEHEKSRQYIETILDEGIRLSNMVSELLSIAKIESGKEGLHPRPVDIRHVLKTVKKTFSHFIRKKKAVINYRVDVKGNLIVDEEKLREMLLIIIDNALTFSDDGCRVDISIDRVGDMVEITVADTGWGISDEDIGHLTERFYRGKHGDKVKGTGLGLSLCEEIVKMHGGTMKIESTVGKGTDVVLQIPCGGKNA